ncbi:complement component C7 isoform 2-T2 [Aulostomus maculatus]
MMRLCVLSWFLLVCALKGLCDQRVHCQWGPYGSWSECDSCTKLQTRSRVMAVYAQFDGDPCNGKRSETRSCETTQPCPLQEGCRDRFRCRSGQCVSQSLVCNGDNDCEDGHDEHVCAPVGRYIVCPSSNFLPNIELLGLGFDVVTGKRRATVINTKSFGGQCHMIHNINLHSPRRLPLFTSKYSIMLKVQNDFSDEMFMSEWHYAKDIVNRQTVTGTTQGYHNYDFHQSHDTTQTHRLLVLKNNIEIAQFQTTSPQYIPISEEFWRAVTKLPNMYDYVAYRKVLERFGTHYLSEGNLGGSFSVVTRIDKETEKHLAAESSDYSECDKTQRWFLIFPISIVRCRSDQHQQSSSSDLSRGTVVEQVDLEGGDVSHIAALKKIQLSNSQKNWEMYSNWADSVRSFPGVIKQKLRPLSELVKEVQCAGLKRLYLRRAIEQYLMESDTCHCRPCSNNGMAVMDGDVCKCICKPGTSGAACELGSEADGQQGVIHGCWSCWSAWSRCSGGQRSRSRSCSRPAPQNGGQSCIGESSETSGCDGEDMQYLKTMEPQCFDQALAASQKCGTPPALINGYILNPKDIYLVGSKVEYTCTEGFYLAGSSILECTADQTWSTSLGLCTRSSCKANFLPDGVIATPSKPLYDIGETVAFSCLEGQQLIGEDNVICDSSLHFSPDPSAINCIPVVVEEQTRVPLVSCTLWEKSSRGICVCRMPFECHSSLEVCATNPGSGKSVLISVCKLHALKCMKKTHVLADDSSCVWPLRNITTGCANCQMWETCDAQTNECRCKDSADCEIPGISVCVRISEDATAAAQTMSECEAGLRRCKGEAVTVVSIMPCSS